MVFSVKKEFPLETDSRELKYEMLYLEIKKKD